MGNSSRKNLKLSTTQSAPEIHSNNYESCDGILTKDEQEEDYSSDDEEMNDWLRQIASTSKTPCQKRQSRQCSEPIGMESRRSSSSACQDRKMTDPANPSASCRQRSKSIYVNKKKEEKCVIPSKTNSVRERRSSGSPMPNGQTNQTNDLHLSIAQINLVRKLWQQVRVHGENGPGLSILRDHLFFRCPTVRQIFSTDSADMQSSETCFHKRLIVHAETLSDILDELVTNLERPQIVRDKLRHWGRAHANFRHLGFTHTIWDKFAEALNDCTYTWCQKAQRCFEAQLAWTTIVLYISQQLKDSYYEECRRQRRSGKNQMHKTNQEKPSTETDL